jgi:adenosylcobinamide-GDP ribazoletransferase
VVVAPPGSAGRGHLPPRRPGRRPDGLGALVAGTVGPIALTAGTVAVALAPSPPCRAARGRGRSPCWPRSPSVLLLRHAVRRLGGVTGDVLGASVEVTTTLIYLGLVLSG